MPLSGAELKFEPELFRTGPKFGSKFRQLLDRTESPVRCSSRRVKCRTCSNSVRTEPYKIPSMKDNQQNSVTVIRPPSPYRGPICQLNHGSVSVRLSAISAVDMRPHMATYGRALTVKLMPQQGGTRTEKKTGGRFFFI